MNGRAHRTLAEKVLLVMYVIALIVVVLDMFVWRK